MDTILAVPGLSKMTDSFRAKLFQIAKRNGWDADAMATVISSESAFKHDAKNPYASASGLIQFLDSTAKHLGVAGGAAEIRAMSPEKQLPVIEKFYQRIFKGRTPRLVDYYLAGWGNGFGEPFDHVLARADAPKTYTNGTHNVYTMNAALDVDKNGVITVGDLHNKLMKVQAQAGGNRLKAESGSVAAAILAGLAGLGLGVAALKAKQHYKNR